MDNPPLPWFGELYYSLSEYTGEHGSQDILFPWMKNAKQIMERLAPYGKLEARLWHEEKEEVRDDLYHWYALSRVNDQLLLALQPEREGYTYAQPVHIEINDYLHFFVELGMHPFDHPTFHPFYHEIVEVEQAEDPNAPIELLEVFWPGLLLGHLLFSRAGVKVRGGANFIDKKLAEQSRLFFTFTRRSRLTRDLSQGWGSNSQWRTDFRRDYTDSSFFYYNVDGKYDLSRPDRVMQERERKSTQPLSRVERIELLVNRCMICTKHVDYDEYDYWPFYDTYVEEKARTSISLHTTP